MSIFLYSEGNLSQKKKQFVAKLRGIASFRYDLRISLEMTRFEFGLFIPLWIMYQGY